MDDRTRADFDPERGVVHDAEELHRLIARLTKLSQADLARLSSDEDRITVRDVSEALSLPESEVMDALEHIHREAWEARFSQAIREAEEPLYRVERTATSNADPLDNSPIHRLRSVQILTDMARPRFTREKSKPAEKESPTLAPLANFILYAVVLGVLVFLGKAILLAFASR